MNSIQLIELNLPFIPQNYTIDKEEIEALTSDQILQLQQYIDVTFPEFTYTNLDNIITSCIILGNRIPENSLILCPGDSPYKISYLIEYIFNSQWSTLNYETSITSNGITFSYPIKKYVKFVRFPISGVSEGGIDRKLLDAYMWKQNLYYDIQNGLHIGIMDYSDSGGSVRILRKSLKRVYGVENITNYDVWEAYHEIFDRESDIKQTDRDFFFRTIAEAERTNCRCQSKYKLGQEQVKYNQYRCNAMLALLYLRFLGKLDENYEWLPRNVMEINDQFTYEITYYDTLTLSTNTATVSGERIYNNEIWLSSDQRILLNNAYSVVIV